MWLSTPRIKLPVAGHDRPRVGRGGEEMVRQPDVVPGVEDEAFPGAGDARQDRVRKALLHGGRVLGRQEREREEELPPHGSALVGLIVLIGFDDGGKERFLTAAEDAPVHEARRPRPRALIPGLAVEECTQEVALDEDATLGEPSPFRKQALSDSAAVETVRLIVALDPKIHLALPPTVVATE